MRLSRILLTLAVNIFVEASPEADSMTGRIILSAVAAVLAVNICVEASPEADSMMERILNSWQSLRDGYLRMFFYTAIVKMNKLLLWCLRNSVNKKKFSYLRKFSEKVSNL
jgi:hypothetical protein